MSRLNTVKYNICVLLILLLVAVSFVGCSKPLTYLQTNNVVFGGGIRLEAAIAGGNAQQALQQINDVAVEVNNSIRLDDDYDSLLKAFNNGGMPIWHEYPIDVHIYKMMSTVLKYYELVQGHFNPAILPIAQLWNVDVEGMAKYGYDFWSWNTQQPEYLPDMDDIHNDMVKYGLWDENKNIIPLTASIKLIDRAGQYYMSKLNPKLKLDLGGIGKGYLADLCGDIVASNNVVSASFNISGDIYVYGEHIRGTPWRVEVQDPRPRMSWVGRNLVVATQIVDSGLVTSGDYQRFYLFHYNQYDGSNPRLVQHIVNPLTGTPVGLYRDQSYWYNQDMAVSSATVVHPSAMVAEILSTAIVAAGLEKGIEIVTDFVAKEGYGVGAFVLEDDSNQGKTTGRYAIVGDFELYEPDTYNAYQRYNKYN